MQAIQETLTFSFGSVNPNKLAYDSLSAPVWAFTGQTWCRLGDIPVLPPLLPRYWSKLRSLSWLLRFYINLHWPSPNNGISLISLHLLIIWRTEIYRSIFTWEIHKKQFKWCQKLHAHLDVLPQFYLYQAPPLSNKCCWFVLKWPQTFTMFPKL